MSLMAAGVPIKKPVAGISCGLVTGDTDDDYIVLTDIQGLEDFFGDMDFKVAGTHDGITAIQMDIKIHGLTRQIVEEAIARTKQAREYILTNVMEPVISERVFAKRLPSVYENVAYHEGLCPVAEKVQKQIMQMKTNYRDLELAKQKAKVLEDLIRKYR